MSSIDLVTKNYTPLQGKKHCQIFLIFMIIVSLAMMITFIGALYEGILASKPVIVFASLLQVAVYLVTFYVYRVFYSMCVKAM